MMRLCVDCRFSSLPVGIGRYTRGLIPELVRAAPDIACTLIVRDTSEPWLASLPDNARLVVSSAPHYSVAEHFAITGIIRRERCDVFFSPHFTVPIRCPVPFVCTVHDLILHQFPNAASPLKRFAYRRVIGHAVTKAHAIVTVSGFVRDEIRREYGDSASGICVTAYPGIDSVFSRRGNEEVDAALKRLGVARPYFLYVGATKEHKRVPLLIEAFARMRRDDVSLVIATGGREAEQLAAPRNVKIVTHADDATLAALYSGAASFVSASIYEGFGLPFIEAMACGCPVIGVNRSSIPEVTGGLGMLTEPSVEALTAALMRRLESPVSPQERDAMVAHSATFRWDLMPTTIVPLLRSAIEK